VALVAPYARASRGEAMLWQSVSRMWFRMPEGYMFVPYPAVNSADPPASATQTTLVALEKGNAVSLDDPLRRALGADLDRWAVQAVIVGPMPNRDAVVGLYTDLLGAPPEWTQGVALWRRSAKASSDLRTRSPVSACAAWRAWFAPNATSRWRPIQPDGRFAAAVTAASTR
jgi:hypothetical protein